MTKLTCFEKQSSWFLRKAQGKTVSAETPGKRDQGTWSGQCRGGCLVWEVYESSSMGLVSLGLWEVRNFRSFPSPLAAPLQAHTSCRSRLSLSPNPGPCHSLDSTRASCSPCVCQGSKGEILCWTRVSFVSPRAHGKVPHVQVGKSIGYLIFQDVAYLLRIPSLFSN